jgi:hypothetical protein
MNRICTPCFRPGRQAVAVGGVFAAGAVAEDVAVADGAVQPGPERRFVRSGEVLRPVLEELRAGQALVDIAFLDEPNSSVT